MEINDITYQIRGAAYTVHSELGPGLLEKVYQEALYYQLIKQGLKAEREVNVPILYDGHQLATDLKIDILVEDAVIVELKSVETLSDLHKKQIQTYLKLSNKQVGLLINFNVASLNSKAIVRCVNNYIETN